MSSESQNLDQSLNKEVPISKHTKGNEGEVSTFNDILNEITPFLDVSNFKLNKIDVFTTHPSTTIYTDSTDGNIHLEGKETDTVLTSIKKSECHKVEENISIGKDNRSFPTEIQEKEINNSVNDAKSVMSDENSALIDNKAINKIDKNSIYEVTYNKKYSNPFDNIDDNDIVQQNQSPLTIIDATNNQHITMNKDNNTLTEANNTSIDQSFSVHSEMFCLSHNGMYQENKSSEHLESLKPQDISYGKTMDSSSVFPTKSKDSNIVSKEIFIQVISDKDKPEAKEDGVQTLQCEPTILNPREKEHSTNLACSGLLTGNPSTNVNDVVSNVRIEIKTSAKLPKQVNVPVRLLQPLKKYCKLDTSTNIKNAISKSSSLTLSPVSPPIKMPHSILKNKFSGDTIIRKFSAPDKKSQTPQKKFIPTILLRTNQNQNKGKSSPLKAQSSVKIIKIPVISKKDTSTKQKTIFETKYPKIYPKLLPKCVTTTDSFDNRKFSASSVDSKTSSFISSSSSMPVYSTGVSNDLVVDICKANTESMMNASNFIDASEITMNECTSNNSKEFATHLQNSSDIEHLTIPNVHSNIKEFFISKTPSNLQNSQKNIKSDPKNIPETNCLGKSELQTMNSNSVKVLHSMNMIVNSCNSENTNHKSLFQHINMIPKEIRLQNLIQQNISQCEIGTMTISNNSNEVYSNIKCPSIDSVNLTETEKLIQSEFENNLKTNGKGNGKGRGRSRGRRPTGTYNITAQQSNEFKKSLVIDRYLVQTGSHRGRGRGRGCRIRGGRAKILVQDADKLKTTEYNNLILESTKNVLENSGIQRIKRKYVRRKRGRSSSTSTCDMLTTLCQEDVTRMLNAGYNEQHKNSSAEDHFYSHINNHSSKHFTKIQDASVQRINHGNAIYNETTKEQQSNVNQYDNVQQFSEQHNLNITNGVLEQNQGLYIEGQFNTQDNIHFIRDSSQFQDSYSQFQSNADPPFRDHADFVFDKQYIGPNTSTYYNNAYIKPDESTYYNTAYVNSAGTVGYNNGYNIPEVVNSYNDGYVNPEMQLGNFTNPETATSYNKTYISPNTNISYDNNYVKPEMTGYLSQFIDSCINSDVKETFHENYTDYFHQQESNSNSSNSVMNNDNQNNSNVWCEGSTDRNTSCDEDVHKSPIILNLDDQQGNSHQPTVFNLQEEQVSESINNNIISNDDSNNKLLYYNFQGWKEAEEISPHPSMSVYLDNDSESTNEEQPDVYTNAFNEIKRSYGNSTVKRIYRPRGSRGRSSLRGRSKPEKPYICPVCGICEQYNVLLERHVRIQHGYNIGRQSI